VKVGQTVQWCPGKEGQRSYRADIHHGLEEGEKRWALGRKSENSLGGFFFQFFGSCRRQKKIHDDGTFFKTPDGRALGAEGIV